MKFDGFDWDKGNYAKCKKHGVSVEEVESLFFGAPLVGPDDKHSVVEQRFRAVGRTAKGRDLFVVFTLRRRGDDILLRPISARYMHEKEVEAYGKKEVP
jgi:uncharacterized DUF497 family protein